MIEEQVVGSKSQFFLKIVLVVAVETKALNVLICRKSGLEISGIVRNPLIITVWTADKRSS